MLHHLIEQLLGLIGSWGYLGVTFLMFLESTVFPVPSELVIPPAAMLAYRGDLNVYLVVLAGTVGSLGGASFNYVAALYLGKPFLEKFGKWFLLPAHKLAKVEAFFLKHGEIGTFTGRLILGIRHFISIPAGLARMNLAKFALLTSLGSGLWCAILAAIGWRAGEIYDRLGPAGIENFFHVYGKQAAYLSAAACFMILGIYTFLQLRPKKVGSGNGISHD